MELSNNNQDQTAAIKTERAFIISEQALGYFKDGINHKSANLLAELLVKELAARAVVVTDTEMVLAHVLRDSTNQDNININNNSVNNSSIYNAIDKLLADPFQLDVFKQAVTTSTIQVLKHDQLLQATLIIPFNCAKQAAGTIIINFTKPEQIGTIEVVLAEGLGRLISYQLSLLETEKLRILLKDTEVRSLQAQINPHFLFNTLNTIVSLIRVNPEQARMVMVHLANFMRMNLKMMASPLVSLEQELVLLESYIQIIEIRFADQLTVELDIADDLEFFRIPPATIQPLLENSIRHGLKKTTKDGKIVVSIHRIEAGARVIITDNGSGIPEEVLANLAKQHVYSRKGNGIGVYNVNQRLTSLLGDKSQLSIRNLQEGGCEISFFLPLMQSERGYY